MIEFNEPFKVICIDNKFFETKLEIGKIYEAEITQVFMPWPDQTWFFCIKEINFELLYEESDLYFELVATWRDKRINEILDDE
jgi:hypothetical protein